MNWKRSVEIMLCLLAFIQLVCTFNQRNLPKFALPKTLLFYDSIFHLTGGYSFFVPWPTINWDGKYQIIVFRKKNSDDPANKLFVEELSTIGQQASRKIPGWFTASISDPKLLAERKTGIEYVLKAKNPETKEFDIELLELAFPKPGATGNINFQKLYSWNFKP